MFKRWILGFAIGLGGMYYYLYHSGEAVDDATDWAEDAASDYRGDGHHRLADEVLGGRGGR